MCCVCDFFLLLCVLFICFQNGIFDDRRIGRDIIPNGFKLFQKFCDWPFNINYNKQGKCQAAAATAAATVAENPEERARVRPSMANASYIMHAHVCTLAMDVTCETTVTITK